MASVGLEPQLVHNTACCLQTQVQFPSRLYNRYTVSRWERNQQSISGYQSGSTAAKLLTHMHSANLYKNICCFICGTLNDKMRMHVRIKALKVRMFGNNTSPIVL